MLRESIRFLIDGGSPSVIFTRISARMKGPSCAASVVFYAQRFVDLGGVSVI